jgi:molecular chaperone DnaK (HSP70)
MACFGWCSVPKVDEDIDKPYSIKKPSKVVDSADQAPDGVVPNGSESEQGGFKSLRSSHAPIVENPGKAPSKAESYAKVEEVTEFGPVSSKERAPANIEWVVGLDFGTTYSGFAYAKASDPEHIHVYYDWPSRNSEKPYCKTLTGIYYTEGKQGKLQCATWGHHARSDSVLSTAKGVYLSKFKLLLKKDLNDPFLASSVPPPLTVNTIITDYLRRIGELALTVIKNHEGDVSFNRDAVQWCVTVPSIWDESAKQQMKACMVNAGLVSGDGGIESVKVVLEPEAASFHCHQILRQKHKDLSLHVKDKILVADVGGGTVDIVVQELIGSGNDYKVQELTESSGGLCGGTFVDESFMRFLYRKIGCLDEFLRSGVPSYRTRLLKDWEEIKCGFGHEMVSNKDTKEITLHNKLASKWEAYEAERGYPPRESYGEIELTQQDLKSIFDPVVDEIVELIAAQLMQVEDIKVMFVVGGFAGSPYLMQRIRKRFSREVKHIVSPPNPGSAIIQGSVALALNPDAVVARILKKTYGTSVTLPFEKGVDPSEFLKVGEDDGVEWCRNRFDSFVKKGARIEVNKFVTKEYVPHTRGQAQMMFDLYSSNEQEPRYTEGPTVTREGGFAVSLPESYSMDDMPIFEFSMYFGRSNIELRAEAQFKQNQGEKARTMELPVRYYS